MLFIIEADPTPAGKHGETAAILASKRGHVDVLRVLVPAAVPKPIQDPAVPVDKPSTAEKKSRSSSPSKSGGAVKGKAAGKEALNKQSADAEIPPLTLRQIIVDHVDKSGMTPLMWAARNGKLDVAAELLQYTTNTDPGEIECDFSPSSLIYI